MRQYVIFAFAVSALLGSLVALSATIQQRDYDLRGYVDPTQSHDLPFAAPRLGVNVELTQYTPAELANHFTLMLTANITWVRQFARWDEIEPQPGVYDWSAWDVIVDTLSEFPDLRLVAVLVNSPTWARTSDDPTAPPDDPQTFADFARAFAGRYGHSVDHYQVWDEPNLSEGWGGISPRPAAYLALLQAGYNAIHNADESALVIAGALAPTTERGPHNISDALYLRDLYALGAQDYFDAVGAKPYGFNTGADDRQADENTLNFSRVILLREEMVRHGDGRKAIWASHWGWNSLPPDWPGDPSIWGAVSAEQQTEYTVAALARAEREWPWLAGMILHHWQPAAAPDDPQWGFALINPDDTPSPLYHALTQHPYADHAANGLFFAANPYARYSGVWKFSDLGADIGWINDSRLTFDFNGRDLALLLREDDYVAYLYPTINGQQPDALPVDVAGNAYIILTSPSLSPELTLVTVARNLPDSEHTLHAVADKLVLDDVLDRWALVGYAVSSGDLAAPYNRQIAAAGLAALAAAGALVITATQIQWRKTLLPLAGLWRTLGSTGQLALSVMTSLALMTGMLLTWGDAVPNLFRREPVALVLAVLSAGLVYLQPGFVLTIAALIVLFVVIYNRLDLGLMLVVFWSPFFLFPVELYRFAFPIAEIMILLTAAAWVIRSLANWARQRQSQASHIAVYSVLPHITALDAGVGLWLALSLVSLTWADLRAPAITDLRVMTIEPVLFYLILRTTTLDKNALLRLVDALLVAGFLVAVIGLWLFFQGAVITAEGGAQRLVSVYGSPNNVGLFLGRCIPFALAFLLIKTDQPRRILAGIALLVMLGAVAFSQSAGALFIGIPAAVAAVLLLVWGKRALWSLAALAGLAGAVFVIALQSARFARLLDFSSGTNFARIRLWQSTVNILRDYPLTGIGADQFLYTFRSTYIMPDAWQEPDLSHPHNVVLDFWSRLGFFGVLIFIWIQVAFWRSAIRAYQHHRTRDYLCFALMVGTMGSMVNLLSHGLVDNSIFVQDLAYVYVLLLGLVAGLSNTRAIDAQA